MTKKPWETEDWHKAKGVVAEPNETNSALARRDYSVPCECHSENLIQVVAGYWLWWCPTHHQPMAWCKNARLQLTIDFLMHETEAAKELRGVLQAIVDEMNTEHAGFEEFEAAITPLWQRAEQILARSPSEPETSRLERGEMEQMAEQHKHLLAEETLRAHNMSTLFSYRYAFILGLEKATELTAQKTSHKEEQQK